jgi:hypothetical protein
MATRERDGASNDEPTEIAALRAELTTLQAEVAQLRAAAPMGEQRGHDQRTSRRQLFKTLGVTAVGAAAAAVANSPRSAEAAFNGTAIGASTNNYGILSVSNLFPLPAVSAGNFGVLGVTSDAGAIGRLPANVGVAGAGNVTVGVAGVTNVGTGVHAESGSGNAVFGVIPASSSSNSIALYGQNLSSYAGPAPGAGGFGVYGLSANGHGLVGATAAAGGAAVVGASNGVAGAYAGAFYGSVVVSGAFTVFGGPKSAAVEHPDGSCRRLYCMEAPEAWFEDFGEGQLVGGKADVPIDPDFAAVVDPGSYHVFLTEHDDHHGLTVKGRGPAGFSVEADETLVKAKGKEAAQVSATFSWRVVAKRKDSVGKRLERVEFPTAPALPRLDDCPTVTNESGRSRAPSRP